VREDRYQFSFHALEEMDEDSLTEEDIRWIILLCTEEVTK